MESTNDNIANTTPNQSNNDWEDIKTEHFEVKMTKYEEENRCEAKFFFKGEPVEVFADDTIKLNTDQAYDTTIEELKQLPCAIQLNRSKVTEFEAAEGPHVKTICNYTEAGVVVGIIIFEPKDQFFEHPWPNEKYLTSMEEVVKNDSRLTWDPVNDEFEPLDIDQIIELQYGERPIAYSPIGPFSFFVTMDVKTFGELSLALDQLMYELEEKAKLYY
jgi:hypothetical protein